MTVAPFGIPFFSDVADLAVIEEVGQAKYRVRPPAQHAVFSDYVVQAMPATGIVWIKASSAPMVLDAYGNGIQSEVDRVARQLEQRYGRGNKNDMLFAGSIWDEPQYWVNGLVDQQRVYFYLWENSRSLQLPDPLVTIYVGAVAYSVDEGAVTIEYSSNRMSEVEREIEQELANLL
jgi:hypothetical protein